LSWPLRSIVLRRVPLPFADTCLQAHSHVICLRERRHAPLIASFLAVVEALRGECGEVG
jgi:hypothetical protein